MTTFNEKEFRIGTAEYDRDFWDTCAAVSPLWIISIVV